MNSGADGADGHARRPGDLVVAELGARVQQQRVALGGVQPAERRGQLGAQPLGLGTVERVFELIVRPVARGAAQRPLAASGGAKPVAQPSGGRTRRRTRLGPGAMR